MVDASKGFRKDGPKNRLREQDIHRIVDTFTRQQEIPGYSRMVPVAEISDAKNDYNLNLPRYIDSTEAEDIQDLTAHLRGGIPDRDLDGLARYWDVLPAVRAALFKPQRPGYSQLSTLNSKKPSSSTPSSPPSTNPPPSSSPSGKRPPPRRSRASPRTARPRPSLKPSPKTC
jgi:type I restriction enzyme M protein